jgi:hypothetical protein
MGTRARVEAPMKEHPAGGQIRRASWLTIVTLVTLVSIASPASGTSIGIHPGELADVILIFRPHEDHLLCVAERVVRGDILKIEKGLAPGLIVCPAGTIGPEWRAGVPITLYLKAFTDRDAHYPIGAFRADVPKPPAITVSVRTGLATIHATSIPSPVVAEALLTIPDSEWTEGVDVYVGVTLPSGESFSWVGGNDPSPRLAASATPTPLLVGVVPTQPATFSVVHTFTTGNPLGWYRFYGLVVPAGADPVDPRRWLNASFFPFHVTPLIP